MNKPTSYFLYHLHSDYSLLDSCTDFKEYVDLVKQSGGTAIASTEHGFPRGWVSKKMYCDEQDIKFVHGVEIYLTEQLEPKVRDNYHTVLLAKNQQGIIELNRLMRLSSDSEHFYYTNRLFLVYLKSSKRLDIQLQMNLDVRRIRMKVLRSQAKSSMF